MKRINEQICIQIAEEQIERLKQQISLYRKLLGGDCRIVEQTNQQ